jgi:hypothetical protein
LDVLVGRYFMEVFNEELGPKIKLLFSSVRKLVAEVQQYFRQLRTRIAIEDRPIVASIYIHSVGQLEALSSKNLEIENYYLRRIARIEALLSDTVWGLEN